MASARSSEKRALAVDFTGRGFGFVVFEGADQPIDWAVKQSGPQAGDRTTDQVKRLCLFYRPDVVILRSVDDSSSSRSARRVILTKAIVALVTALRIKCHFVSWTTVRNHFGGQKGTTKHVVANGVAYRLPALAPRMPPIRKPWMAEDYRMAIFEAAALGIVYYANRRWRHKITSHESGD